MHKIYGNASRAVITACAEVCGKTRHRRNRGDSWWWNEDVKEAIARKKDAYKELCKNNTEENKINYKKMKKSARFV